MPIRCNTPSILKFSMLVVKGYIFNAKPIAKIIAPRFISRNTWLALAVLLVFLNEKNIAEPIINMKNGKITSVGVHPCQSA